VCENWHTIDVRKEKKRKEKKIISRGIGQDRTGQDRIVFKKKNAL